MKDCFVCGAQSSCNLAQSVVVVGDLLRVEQLKVIPKFVLYHAANKQNFA